MLDPRRLHVLREVVDAGSITRAAAALGFTPSAVSQTLRALEREAKAPLFEKAGRGLRPTQAALLLAGHARTLAAHLEHAEAELEALRSGKVGRIRLATFATAGASLVPRAVAGFKADHPDVELDLSVVEAPEALTALRSGDVDLALVAEHRPPPAEPDLVRTRLLDDPYRIVVPRDHPASAARTVSLQTLHDEAWISTASARCNCEETVTAACARAGYTPRFAVEADEFATTLGFVAAGMGVAMIPLLALSSVPEGVSVLRIRAHEPKRRVYSVARRGNAAQPLVVALEDALRRSAGTHLRSAA